MIESAYNTLANDGLMPLAGDHSCSECTKPYKPTSNQDPKEVEDAEPVKIIVMDGIVMGPLVFFNFLESLYSNS